MTILLLYSPPLLLTRGLASREREPESGRNDHSGALPIVRVSRLREILFCRLWLPATEVDPLSEFDSNDLLSRALNSPVIVAILQIKIRHYHVGVVGVRKR